MFVRACPCPSCPSGNGMPDLGTWPSPAGKERPGRVVVACDPSVGRRAPSVTIPREPGLMKRLLGRAVLTSRCPDPDRRHRARPGGGISMVSLVWGDIMAPPGRPSSARTRLGRGTPSASASSTELAGPTWAGSPRAPRSPQPLAGSLARGTTEEPDRGPGRQPGGQSGKSGRTGLRTPEARPWRNGGRSVPALRKQPQGHLGT